MPECYKSGDFKKYFTQNMNALGLPVPKTMFDSYNATIAQLAMLTEALSQLGKSATIGELIGATTKLEKLKVAAAFGASYYIGAAIGSFGVATGRSFSCGRGVINLFVLMDKYNIVFEGRDTFYLTHSEILNKSHIFRRGYKVKALS